ncbi:MAG: flagellar M-ring protein FliF C-terminal domain-containing protein, partial [Oscillospiraceae bacterium]
ININPKQSSASVVVRLKNNAGLSEQQLSGIRHIVLTAVEGLTEENITITDGAGNLLETGSLPEDTISLERNKLNFKKEVEDTIRSEVGKMFVPIYSEKGFNVSVSSVLNYDKEVSEDTKYTPSNDNGSGMVEHEDTKNNSGTDGTIAGGVGVDPNAGDDNPTGTAGMGGAWSNSENSTSYLVNTLKKQTEKQGYTVEDLTVSVMIYTELLSDEDIAKYTTAVARAAGITEDFVSVMNAPKGFEEASKTPTAYPFGMSRTQFFMYIITLVMVIIFFMVLYANVSKRAKKKRKRYERMAYELATNVQGGSVEDKFAGQRPQPGSVASLRDSQNVETKESAVRREIADFSDNSPEVVAQLLKSWLREESDGNGGSGGGSRSSGKSGGK